jgi:hypothetical protein
VEGIAAVEEVAGFENSVEEEADGGGGPDWDPLTMLTMLAKAAQAAPSATVCDTFKIWL